MSDVRIGTTWHTTGVLWRLRPGDTERETELISSTWRTLHELECQPPPSASASASATASASQYANQARTPAPRHPSGPVAGERTGIVQNGGLFIASCPDRLREYSRLVPVCPPPHSVPFETITVTVLLD